MDCSSDAAAGRLFLLLALAAPLGCTRWQDKLEASRKSMLATVTPCPEPATCSARVTSAGREVAICDPAAAGQPYANGDIVIVKDLGVHTLARVKGRTGSSYSLEFADGNVLDRYPAPIVGRACR